MKYYMLGKYTSLFFLFTLSVDGHRLAYNPEEFRVGQSKCFVLDANSTIKEKPWVWYAPTLPRHPDPSHTWYIDKLIQEGISFAGCDQGEVRGSPKSVDRFTNFYNKMVDRGYSKQPVLLGQSRGGLMMLSWAIKNPKKLRAFAGIYPVLNLRSWPMKRNLSSTLVDFSMDQDTFFKSVDLHNPIHQLGELAAAKVPLFIVHGDSDRIVPLEENTEIVINRYTKLGGKAEVKVVPGKGHQVCDDFFKSKELIEFIIQLSKH
jgi:alpha-beta hydrolase superfamily lysophospholipase